MSQEIKTNSAGFYSHAKADSVKTACRELIICDQKREEGSKSDNRDPNSEKREHLPEFTAIYYVFYFQKEKKIKRFTRFPMRA